MTVLVAAFRRLMKAAVSLDETYVTIVACRAVVTILMSWIQWDKNHAQTRSLRSVLNIDLDWLHVAS
jgi:hypothetical protein